MTADSDVRDPAILTFYVPVINDCLDYIVCGVELLGD